MPKRPTIAQIEKSKLQCQVFCKADSSLISILPPIGLTEELCFFGHVSLDLSPVDVKTKQGADVRRAEQIKDQQLFEDSLTAYMCILRIL